MEATPSAMKAVILTGVGALDKLQYTENHPIPKLAPGQLLVRNEIAGINFADIYVRTGHYPAGGSFPVVSGLEGIGLVTEIAEPNPLGFQIGDRVLWQGSGGYAEYSAVLGDKAVKVRPEISSEDAVGTYITGITALSLIDQAYTPASGETVLVHAAAGGVGLMLCQLLKHRGVNVIGTVSNESKFGIVKRSGAQHVITYKSSTGKDWVDQVKDLTDGKGVHAVSRFILITLQADHVPFRCSTVSGKTLGKEASRLLKAGVKWFSLGCRVCFRG